METIYAVYAKGVDRDTLLGYATGKVADIQAAYDDKKAYGLDLKPIKVHNIPPGVSVHLKELKDKEVNLIRQLAEIKRQQSIYMG